MAQPCAYQQWPSISATSHVREYITDLSSGVVTSTGQQSPWDAICAPCPRRPQEAGTNPGAAPGAKMSPRQPQETQQIPRRRQESQMSSRRPQWGQMSPRKPQEPQMAGRGTACRPHNSLLDTCVFVCLFHQLSLRSFLLFCVCKTQRAVYRMRSCLRKVKLRIIARAHQAKHVFSAWAS